MNYLNVPGVTGYDPSALNINTPIWQTPGYNPHAMDMGPTLSNPLNITPGAIDAAANYQPGLLHMTDPVPDLKDQSRIPGLKQGGMDYAAMAGLLGNILGGGDESERRPPTPAPVAQTPGVYRPFNLWDYTR